MMSYFHSYWGANFGINIRFILFDLYQNMSHKSYYSIYTKICPINQKRLQKSEIGNQKTKNEHQPSLVTNPKRAVSKYLNYF